MRNILVGLSALILLASLDTAHAQAAPDTIYLNGKIVAVDDYLSIAEAVAVPGDSIQAVGSNEDTCRR